MFGRFLTGRWGVVYLLFALFAFDALRQLEGLLRGMHRSGQPSFGVGGLSSLHPERVPAVWRDHASTYASIPDAPSTYKIVYGLHVTFDSLFVVALALLLLTVVRRLDELPSTDAGRLRDYAELAVGAFVVFDLLENALSALVVYGEVGVGPAILAASVWKWISFAAAFLFVGLFAGVRWASADSGRQLRRLIGLLRMQVLVVLGFIVLLGVHEQLPDLIRRWSFWQLLVTVVAVAFLAVVVWVLALDLIAEPDRTPRWLPRRGVLAKGLIVAALLQGATSLVLTYVFDLPWDVGWGLLVPAAFLAILAAGARLLPSTPMREESDPPPLGYGSKALPPILAAAVLVGLGLAIVRATFGDAVYTKELWSTGDLWRGFTGQLHPALLVAIGVVVLPALAWVAYGWLLSLGDRLTHDAPEAEEKTAVQQRVEQQRRITSAAVIVAIVVVQLVIAALVWESPWGTGERFGGVALFAIALAGITIVGTALIWVSNQLTLPERYRNVGLRRIPLLLLLVLWFVVAAKLDSVGPYDVRVREVAENAVGPNVDQAWSCWLLKNGLDPRAQEADRRCPFGAGEFARRSDAPQAAVPLVFVASSGGATRAAYWTATVLDCAFEVEAKHGDPCEGNRVAGDDFRRTNAIFALSGISGGSVGVSTFALHAVEKAETGENGAWIDERLDRDFLSPTAAWALFVEAPQSFLRFRHPQDRAEVLERSWERAWSEGGVDGQLGILELWRDRHEAPLLLLNGTSVEDGCRFNGSALDGSVETERAGKVRYVDCHSTNPFDEQPRKTAERRRAESVLPATRDLVDFLCDGKLDVRVSTTAITSSRFPYVSPTARLETRCAPTDRDEAAKVTYIVDGGYLETSGASTITELWQRLETLVTSFNASGNSCVVPFMIQIDNGYEDDAAAPAVKRPWELVAPGQAIVAARNARAASAKANAALIFDSTVRGATVQLRKKRGATTTVGLLRDRYAHFVIQTHAGPKAPLGWALSLTAMAELRSQLRQPKNAAALAEVQDWLGRDALSCS